MKINAGLKVLVLLFTLIITGLFAIGLIAKGDLVYGALSGSIALTSIFLAIKITFKDMDKRQAIYDATTKELIAFKDEVEKALTKDELKPLFIRLKEYQVKFKMSDPYFMYLIDICQGMMQGKISILDNK